MSISRGGDSHTKRSGDARRTSSKPLVLVPLRPNKKYVCFRLPTVPMFRSLTLIFFIIVYGFLQLILLAEKCFQFKSIFVSTYIKTNFTKSVFVTFTCCR